MNKRGSRGMKKYQIALIGGIVLLIGQIIVLLLPLRPQTGPVGEPHGLNWQGFFQLFCHSSLLDLSGGRNENKALQ